MKKTLITIVLLFLGILSSAQDTLTRPPNYCAYHYWPCDYTSCEYDSMSFHIHDAFISNPNFFFDNISGTTLDKQYTIYGISASLYTPLYIIQNYGIIENEQHNFSVIDIEGDNLCEKVRQYSRQGDSLYVEREVKWCYKDHPADWYFSTGYGNGYCLEYWDDLFRGPAILPSIMPMYDFYFDEPFIYNPDDTLYLGISTTSTLHRNYITFSSYPVSPVRIRFHTQDSYLPVTTDILDYRCISDTSSMHGFYPQPVHSTAPKNMVIYPIIAPPPPPPAPQISIQPIEEVKVNLYPNPATDMVKITSSISMTGISAISIDGRTIYNKPHSGKTTTMDIHTWPAGLYFLTIATPVGNKVQKLLKR